MHDYRQAFHRLRQELGTLYDAGEAGAIAKALLEAVTGITYSESLTRADGGFPAPVSTRLEQAAAELLRGRPLQYVTGQAYFSGHIFRVNEQVLIPRPETEELVQWIIDEWNARQEGCSVLDIGTGSGCIPISLKLALPQSQVTSCDISAGALGVARENAVRLHAAVTLLQLDFLDEQAQTALRAYDVIVSNPPYIPIGEQASLHRNVRDYEPGSALFVPDDDALLFYRAIARFGLDHLKPGGSIYCELHRDYATATQALFAGKGYQTSLQMDINGHLRMLKAWRG